MAEITAALVKELREKTGAGMMDCKKALSETQGDLERRVDWLRKKGLAAAAKKAGRVAAEGLVGVAADGKRGAVVEVNAETDFVARNEQFQDFVGDVARLALDAGDDRCARRRAVSRRGRDVAEAIDATDRHHRREHDAAPQARAVGVGRRGRRLRAQRGGARPRQDRRAGRRWNSTGDDGKARRASASSSPCMSPPPIRSRSTSPTSIQAALERERAVLAEQARASGKPEEIIAKMVEGGLRKFYEEVVLLEQLFVIDGESRVEGGRRGGGQGGRRAGRRSRASVRFALGEGIENEQKDFAAEVAAQLGK